MKNLNHFRTFDLASFLSGKVLAFIKAAPLQERDGEAFRTVGTKVSLFILADETDYGFIKGAEANKGETLVVKVMGKSPEAFADFEYMKTRCKIVDVKKCSVYGDYSNMLSVTADIEATGK